MHDHKIRHGWCSPADSTRTLLARTYVKLAYHFRIVFLLSCTTSARKRRLIYSLSDTENTTRQMGPTVLVPIWSVSPHRLRRKGCAIRCLLYGQPPVALSGQQQSLGPLKREGEPQAGLGAGAGIGAPAQAAETPSHTSLKSVAEHWVCKTTGTAHREQESECLHKQPRHRHTQASTSFAGYWMYKATGTAHRKPCTTVSMEFSGSDFEALGIAASLKASAACPKNW